MNSVTHMTIGGLTGGLVLAYCFANPMPPLNLSGYEVYPLAVTVAGIAGGLAPDIDMARSKAGKFLRRALKSTLAISAMFLVIMSLVPETGIALLDKAIGMGATIDRTIPLVLAAFCVIIMLAINKFKHRGFTHTVVALLMIAAPLCYMLFKKTVFVGVDIVVSAQIGFVLGWFSHMVIDTFNYPGVPWLWPLTSNHINIMRIDSGTSQETMFLVLSTALFTVCYGFIITA